MNDLRLSLWALVSVLLAMAVTAAGIFGQATEGSILGVVTDPSGAPMAGVPVTVTSVQTSFARNTLTNDVGDYLVTNLPPGSYVVKAEMTGFKKAVHPAVEITVKARVRVNLKLEMGEISETVAVSTTAAPLLKTDTVELSTVVRREQLEDLPVVSRHFLYLSVLTPGTVWIPTGRVAEFSGGTGIGAVGVGSQGANQNNFILDGISNNMEFSGAMGVQPSLDAIQEFSVQTSGYSAEFGKAGGGIINVAVRSGSNEIHGFAYDYLRNDILNARPYDFIGNNPPKLPLRRNLFGAGTGLPIIKNKVFLFANYEGLRSPVSAITFARVPTLLERKGDFSQSPFTIYDPLTNHPSATVPGRIERDPFPGNVVPANRIQSGMADLIGYYPAPNFKDTANAANLNNYQGVLKSNDLLDSINLKGDYKFSDVDTITLRYSSQWVTRDRGGFMPDDLISGTGTLNATNTLLAHTRVFGPKLVNEFRMGWNYLRYGNSPTNGETYTDDLGIPGINVKPFFPNINPLNITRTTPVRALTTIPSPFNIVQNSFQYMDNLSWQRGNHALKFGGEISWHRNDTWAPAPGGVEFAYDGHQTTPFVGATREAARNGGADFLLGLSNQFTTYYDYDKTRVRVQRFALFAQDDWRISRRLSLSMGLRYEVLPYWGERLDKLTNFDQTTGTLLVPDTTRGLLTDLGLPNGDLPVGFKYVPTSQVVPATDFLNFAPRFGFAYSISDRVVVRGGFGMYFAGWDANVNNNTGGTPFSVRVRYSGSTSVPVDVRNGFPSGSYATVVNTPFQEISQMIQLGHPDPYTERWNFNVQVSPFERTGVEVGYSGSRAIAMLLNGRFNHPGPGPGDIQSRRPYNLFGDGFGAFFEGDAWYNAMEVTVRQKEIYGLAIDSNFTWSKNTAINGRTNIYDPTYDFGRSLLDYGRRWVTSFVYRVPTPANLHPLVYQIIGGWQTSGIVILQGGFPFSVVANNNMNDNINASRADLTLANGPAQLPVDQRTIQRWFNTAAFLTPPNYVWGNSGINILDSPGFSQVDFGLQKRFRVTERVNVGLRMEAQNLFNRVNLNAPIASTGSAANGQITSLRGDPRQIQMSLRVDF